MFLGFLCLFVGGMYRNVQDKTEKQNMEVQAAGKFDRLENLCEKYSGIRLLGDEKLYPIQNESDICLEQGDSIFVVNQMAFANMPTATQISQKRAPTVRILKK